MQAQREELITKYIKTKNKIRKIVTYADNSELRKYHEKVVRFLEKNTHQSIFAKAYVARASIYKNAEAHLYNDVFLKMDIKDFFPSINHAYLMEVLFYEINKKTPISKSECFYIVKSCSDGAKGLPLGLVTSPCLANLYLKEFDGCFYGAIKKMGLNNPIYTRYADDLVVSFKYSENYKEMAEKIKRLADSLLRKYHLHLNEKKTEVFCLEKNNHVRITGISITKDGHNHRHISVGRKMKEKIFWDTVNMYEADKKDYAKIATIKGRYSFILSIEKRGIEDIFSNRMKQIIYEKGFSSFSDMVKHLDE